MTAAGLCEVVRELDFDYGRYQQYIQSMDAVEVERHNARHPASSRYHLRLDLAPCPFEGDPRSARVILLLANPYADSSTTAQDHVPTGDGWGIWGMSPTASAGMRDWWRPRLKGLVRDVGDEAEWKSLSNQVASFQAIAWASEKFHESSRLPSKALMLETLRQLVQNDPGKLFVVMRQRRHWQQALPVFAQERVLQTRNPLCSYLRAANIREDGGWEKLVRAVGMD